jgi:hypothetical protein
MAHRRVEGGCPKDERRESERISGDHLQRQCRRARKRQQHPFGHAARPFPQPECRRRIPTRIDLDHLRAGCDAHTVAG